MTDGAQRRRTALIAAAIVLALLAGILLGLYVLFGIAMQGMLTLVPNVDAATRWAAVLYCVLPASYLAPGMGRNPRDYTLASGVCSVMTVVCLAAFCVMAAIVA